MSWNFIPDDNFDIDQLHEMKKFLESDLVASKAYLREVQKDQRKFKTLNLTWALSAATLDVEVSRQNLGKCNKAIAITEGRIVEDVVEAVTDVDEVVKEESNKKHWWGN